MGFPQEGGAGASGLGHGGSANVLDVTGATGLEFLSQPEILLCSRLHMLPKYYLAVKASANVPHIGHLTI